MKRVFFLLVLVLLALSTAVAQKHRLLVLTDIEADPDDAQTNPKRLILSSGERQGDAFSCPVYAGGGDFFTEVKR